MTEEGTDLVNKYPRGENSLPYHVSWPKVNVPGGAVPGNGTV